MRLATLAARRFSPFAILIAALLAGMGGVGRVDGRHAGLERRPELVAPAEEQVLGAASLQFAFVPPPGFTKHQLLISDRPFTTDGLTGLPDDPAIRAIPLSSTIVRADDLGLDFHRGDHWYWAIASTEAAGRLVTVSPVRGFTVHTAWPVASPTSPLVRRESRGRSSEPGPLTGSRRLRLAAGFDFDTRQGEPALPAAERDLLAADPGEREALVVQFDGEPGDVGPRALIEQGAIPISYLPDNAWLVRAEPGSRSALARLAGVAWVGDYRPGFRISPRLRRMPAGEVGSFTVLLFADAPLPRARERLAAMGALIETASDNGINRLLRVRMPARLAGEAARLPGVEWVEPWVAPTFDNDNAQWVVQTNVNADRRVWTQGIDGTGQIVHTSDSGITVGHDQFRDGAVPITGFGDFPTHRKIIAYHKGSLSAGVTFGDDAGASFHGTHTGGTICGNDAPNGASARDGMARGARIFFHDMGGPSMGNGLDHFADLNDLYQDAYNGNAAGAPRLSSNSWGSANGGAYDAGSMQIDQFMWSHPDFLIFFSNGNSSSANTVGSPATAKNSVGAGGTGNGTSANTIYSSTSRGPTDDGRRKPTVCSPGQFVLSADGATTTGYKSLSGTSMASPTQAGAATLIRQYLTDGWYPTGSPVPANGFAPSAALLKALVVNSADNGVTGFTAPDNNIGYGRVMADNVLYFAGDTRRLVAIDQTAGLSQGEYIEYEIDVTSGSIPLEVTLCWTDYPSTPAAAVNLVNNLNLTVSRGATLYRGNVYSGGFSTTGGSDDNLNVEEAVLVNAPAVGTWIVRVNAAAVPAGPQPYGLAITGAVDAGNSVLYVDRAEYGATGTMQVRVVDTNALGPLTALVTSPTEPTGETVTLTGGDGLFSGSLRLAPWAPGAPHAAPAALRPMMVDLPDDTLRVSHGDSLTIAYADASPAAVRTARASVSIETPVITGVTALARGSNAARVTWTTDLNATSRVEYGLTPALELGSVSGAAAVLAHDLLVSGLTSGETYWYDVVATGLNGNPVRDDNGGLHYQVTIDPPADVLVLVGDGTFDRLEAWEEALTSAGWSYDVWSGSLADSALLGDRTGGLRSYRAVIWQPGFDQYPPFTDLQRTRVGNYLNGGGRLLVVGHDIAWALGDPASPVYSAARAAWLSAVLHTTWQSDPNTWSQNIGYIGDPISSPYTAGVAYTPIRTGGAGDEIDVVPGSGTASYVWRNNEATADDIGFRWLSNGNDGSPDSAVWGGQPSRLATMYFEWSALRPPFTTLDAQRTDILDRTLIWLIGRDRPTVTLLSPAAGDTVTGDTLSIAWSELTDGGTGVARRTIEYSADGGSSWSLVADSVGASPHPWVVSGLPNRTTMQVRIRVTDTGDPALTGRGATSGNFLLQRPAGDTDGPLVVPGSLVAAPNPFEQALAASISGTVSDAGRGGRPVAAAEWSRGAAPAPAGSGTAMTGPFGSVTVSATALLDTRPMPAGPNRFWMRGRDDAGNWGPAAPFDVQINPGLFARAGVVCPPDTSLGRGDTLAVTLRLINTGTATDTLHYGLIDLGPGPGLTLIGGPLSADTSLAAGDTAAITVSIAAAALAAPGVTTSLKFTAWPLDDPGAPDSCQFAVTLLTPVAVAACNADTTLIAPGTINLSFRVSNAGNQADTLRWSLVDLGPGPGVHLSGGPLSGAVWLDPAGVADFDLPPVEVAGEPTALIGEYCRLRLVVAADRETLLPDSCLTRVEVTATSSVPEAPVPSRLVVLAATPNPFRSATRIDFAMPTPGRVELRIHSADGRLVRTLTPGDLDAGRHFFEWDGRDQTGGELPSGIYFYQLQAGSRPAVAGRVLRLR